MIKTKTSQNICSSWCRNATWRESDRNTGPRMYISHRSLTRR